VSALHRVDSPSTFCVGGSDSPGAGVAALDGKNCNCPAGSRNQVILRIPYVVVVVVVVKHDINRLSKIAILGTAHVYRQALM